MRKLLLVAAAASLLAPAAARASGYEVITIHPRDLALVHSTVAAQDRAPAVFFNPSALSKIDGFSVSVAGSVLSLSTKWTAPAGSGLTGSERMKFEPVPSIAAYVAWGTKLGDRGFGVGFGLGVPGGSNVVWDDDWEGRGRIIEVQRRVLGLYLTSGYELIPGRLRIGGGLIYYRGFEYIKIGIQPDPNAFAELDDSGGAFSFDVSAELVPFKDVPLTLGVDFKYQAKMDLEGDGNFSIPPALEGPTTRDQSVEHELPFPNLLSVGLAYRVAKPVQLTLQYSYSDWSIYQEDRFVGSTGLTIVVPRDYSDGHIVRGGVEWYATDRLTLRAGLMRDFSGLSEAAYSPTLPDASIWAGAVGAGWEFLPGFTVQGAFFYGDRDRVRSTNNATATNPDGTFPGIYDTSVWIASLGLTWDGKLGR
jgi:long-chain fatty acid transport protein